MSTDLIELSSPSAYSVSRSEGSARAIHFCIEVTCDLSTIPVGESIYLETPTSDPDSTRLNLRIKRPLRSDFRIEWETSSGDELVQSAFSTGAIYLVNREASGSQLVAVTTGKFHSSWPSGPLNHALGINLCAAELDAAARKESNGESSWRTTRTYYARLSFFKPWSAVLPSRPTQSPANLTSAHFFSAFNLLPQPHDVRLVFERNSDRKQVSLWTSSELLSSKSPYFATLLESGFAEAKLQTDKERAEEVTNENHEDMEEVPDDRDSDYDLDEAIPDDSVSSSSPSPELSYRKISIRHGSYSTFQAVLVWIQTGYIHFSPLLSSFSHLPAESRKAARLEAIKVQHDLDPRLPHSASPKSVHKLAHYLGLPSLESLALKEISRQLTVENIFTELFDGLATVYEDVRKIEVKFAVAHRKEVVETKGFKEVIEKLRKNELSLSGPVVADLLPLLVG